MYHCYCIIYKLNLWLQKCISTYLYIMIIIILFLKKNNSEYHSKFISLLFIGFSLDKLVRLIYQSTMVYLTHALFPC